MPAQAEKDATTYVQKDRMGFAQATATTVLIDKTLKDGV